MGLHVYCIVPQGHPVPDDCAGLESHPPFALSAGGLALWATEHAERVTPSIEAARIHDGVVRAAMTARVTPVPVRFGQWFSTAGAAADQVTADAGRWAALLDRFAGRAEYGVGVFRPRAETERDVRPAAPESGKEYMAALARKQALAAHRRGEGERIAAEIAARITDLAVEQRVEHSAAGDLLVTVNHLVAWTHAEAYHGAISEVRASWHDVRFAPTGPWPPYSFVE